MLARVLRALSLSVVVLLALPAFASAQAALAGDPSTWGTPTLILPARFAKLSVQVDF